MRGARLVLRDEDVGEGLVVAQQHVVARLELLDQVRLEQQRLGLGARGHELHRRRIDDHAGDAVRMRVAAGVGAHARFQVLGLADVEHLASGVDHAVDARRVRQRFPEAPDHRHAGGEIHRRIEIERGERAERVLDFGRGGGVGTSLGRRFGCLRHRGRDMRPEAPGKGRPRVATWNPRQNSALSSPRREVSSGSGAAAT